MGTDKRLPKKTEKSLEEHVLYYLFVNDFIKRPEDTTLDEQLSFIPSSREETILRAVVDYLRIKFDD